MKRCVFILTIVLMSGAICMAQVLYLSINKDVHNGSEQEAHGLKIVLEGQRTVLQRFDGVKDENHFGDCNETVENDETILWWHDPLRGENNEPRPIPHCEWVHIGYRLDLPAKILEVYWTDENGNRIGDVIGQPTQEVIFDPDSPNLELEITNNLKNEMTVSVELVGYAIVEKDIPLEELNAGNSLFNSNNLTPFAGANGNIQLTSGSPERFDIPRVPNKPDTYAIYLKRGKNGGDGNTVVYRDFGQFGPIPEWEPIPGTGFPTVSLWGLIVMALLLAMAGAIVIRRRQRVAT